MPANPAGAGANGKFHRKASRLWRSQRGAVTIFALFAFLIVMITGVLVPDMGRLVMAQHQMQNAADAAALSAASQFDGRAGAIARATTLAQTTIQNSSRITESSALTVSDIDFFSDLDGTVATMTDSDVRYVRVTLTPQSMILFTNPLLALMQTTNTTTTATLQSSASAVTSPVICQAPPFMTCNPSEGMSSADDIMDAANIGRQLRLKQGGGSNADGNMVPGDFTLLCTTDGKCGASALGNALADPSLNGCTGLDVQTAPGGKTQQIITGMNSRFDQGNKNPHNPARNVIHYPLDLLLAADPDAFMGDNDWNRAAYWSDKHGGVTLPADLIGATRYEVYLYELGETYWTNGSLTIYPTSGSIPSGYTEYTGVLDIPTAVDPANAGDPVYDGEPESTPDADPKRRVLAVAVLNCIADGVNGSGTFSSKGRFVELFVTEQATSDAVVTAEVVGLMNEDTSPEFHNNVTLVE